MDSPALFLLSPREGPELCISRQLPVMLRLANRAVRTRIAAALKRWLDRGAEVRQRKSRGTGYHARINHRCALEIVGEVCRNSLAYARRC